MTDLSDKKCIPCKGNIPPFELNEIHKYLKKVDGWDVKKKEDETYFLEKSFTFKNFFESQKFINQVSDIAEAQGHHPDIVFGWGYAKVQIFTHKSFQRPSSDPITVPKSSQRRPNASQVTLQEPHPGGSQGASTPF